MSDKKENVNNRVMDEIGLEALPVTNYWQDVVRLFTKNRIAVLGLIMMIIIVILCAGAPLFTDHDPITEMNFAELLMKPGEGGHILGTDDLGRDIWSRLLYGGRNSLVTGIAVTMISACVGVAIGLVAGYFGGTL
ncbi:MAG: ABC transporter permease, partial [Firmicutes bacterium]|nr:ABC transporter permease [Bacillota bacterium]